MLDDVNHLEEEKNSLTKKISELEAAILSPSASSAANKALKRLISESPAPAVKRSLDCLDDSIIDGDLSTTPVLVMRTNFYHFGKSIFDIRVTQRNQCFSFCYAS